MKRRLSLTREHLTDLTPDDLSVVAGGGMEDSIVCNPPTLNAPCQQLIWVIKTTVRTITCYC